MMCYVLVHIYLPLDHQMGHFVLSWKEKSIWTFVIAIVIANSYSSKNHQWFAISKCVVHVGLIDGNDQVINLKRNEFFDQYLM